MDPIHARNTQSCPATADHGFIEIPLRSPWRNERSSLGCGIYPLSVELSGLSVRRGTRGRTSQSGPNVGSHRVGEHMMRLGSTWVDHGRSKGYVNRAGVHGVPSRGGSTGRLVRRKSRWDGWDRYKLGPKHPNRAKMHDRPSIPTGGPNAEDWVTDSMKNPLFWNNATAAPAYQTTSFNSCDPAI